MENSFQVGSSGQSDGSLLANGSPFESIAVHLSRFVQVGRALESRLACAEEKVKRLERELQEAHALFDRLLRDEKAKNTEAAVELHKAKNQTQAHKEAEQMVRMQFSTVGAELQKRTAELKQFQERWSAILQREAEAKALLAESEKNVAARQDLEKKLAEAEKTIAEEREMRRKAREQTSAYRKELEHAVRSVDAMLDARSRERVEARTQNQRQAAATESQAQQTRPSVTIKPGMSWMAPRASHDDNPSEMFQAELESWRQSPLSPST